MKKIKFVSLIIFVLCLFGMTRDALAQTNLDITKDVEIVGGLTISSSLSVEGQLGSDVHVHGDVSGVVTVDWNNGNTQHIRLTGNITTFNLINPRTGRKYVLIIQQDGTGSRTISWPATVRWPGGNEPTLSTSANAVDYIGFFYDPVDGRLDGVGQAFDLQ